MKSFSYRFFSIAFILTALFVFVPIYKANAQLDSENWWPVVPCGLQEQPQVDGKPKINADYTANCTPCHLIPLTKNVIDLIFFGLVPTVGTAAFLIGGTLYIIGRGNKALFIIGKGVMGTAITSIVIVSSGWIVTNTILKLITPNDLSDEWWIIKAACGGTGPVSPGVCPSISQLADKYEVSGPPSSPPEFHRSEDLSQLISCMTREVKNAFPSEGATDASALVASWILTYDTKKTGYISKQGSGNDYAHPGQEECNYTRGNVGADICVEQCRWSVNSSHYGGFSGTKSEAVDLEFRNPSQAKWLFKIAQWCWPVDSICQPNDVRGQMAPSKDDQSACFTCEDAQNNPVCCCDPSAHHIHITTDKADTLNSKNLGPEDHPGF